MDLCEVSENTARHPWELSRTQCVLKEIKKISNHKKVLDIGCGDGYFDKKLVDEFKDINEVYGVDIFLDKPYDNGKIHFINSLDNLPDEKFDLVLMMDVIEHIKDDREYIFNIKKYIKDDGVILLTVPAFMKLYSLHDKELKHFRRYDRNMLKRLFDDSGFIIKDMSYFYLSLIFLRLLTMNKTQNLSMWNADEKAFKTRFVKAVLNIDYNVLRFFSKFKIYIGGLSLLAIIEKEKLGEKNDPSE